MSASEREQIRRGLPVDLDVVDLSVNINPFGPPEGVVAAVQTCDLERYPDPLSSELRSTYGRELGVDPDRLVFGNGATELLWTLASCLCKSSPTVIVEPTFSEYARAAQVHGARVVSLWGRVGSPEHAQADDIVREVVRVGARSVYLCRPNNPTGEAMPLQQVEELAEELGEVALVLDESFLSLSELAEEAEEELPPNVIRVRSLTKDFSIPGLRLGYLIATPAVAKVLEASRPPWTTSAPAQAAGAALIEERGFLQRCRARLLHGKAELVRGLSRAGLTSHPSVTIFALAEVGDAGRFCAELRRSGVIVRDAGSFGLPDHVRIAAGSPGMRERLWAALRSRR